MSNLYALSPKEMELMQILWDAAEPLSRQDILDRAEQRQCTWKPNSVHILLNALLKKGAAQVSGYYLNARKLGRTFEPAISRDEYAVMQVGLALEQGEKLLGDALPGWIAEVRDALPKTKA